MGLPEALFVNRVLAPREDDGVLGWPDFSYWPKLAEAGAALDGNDSVRFLGRPLCELRSVARAEVHELSRIYLQRSNGFSSLPRSDRWIVSGHQPDWFHAGVWLKNFVLAAASAKLIRFPLNLIVDQDTFKSAAIAVPELTAAGARRTAVPFDIASAEVPFEERGVLAPDVAADFPNRLAAMTGDWPHRPMLLDYWPKVLRHPSPVWGERFAAVRRCAESRLAICNAELPVSVLCETVAFAHFALELLGRADELRSAYNLRLAEYRHRYRIRGRNHPVPELTRQGDWIETPFWAWRGGDARRARLFVRRSGDRLGLRAGTVDWPTIAAREPGDWCDCLRAGYKIRPRALTATLFARYFLADLFVHGIGGGKYDELTDMIAGSMFPAGPARFVIVSGTWRLPVRRSPVPPLELAKAQRHLRDLTWKPQLFLRGRPGYADPIAERERLLREQPGDRAGRRRRYRRVLEITQRLREPLRDEIEQARRELDQLGQRRRADAVLARRDYNFGLFAEAELAEKLLRAADRITIG